MENVIAGITRCRYFAILHSPQSGKCQFIASRGHNVCHLIELLIASLYNSRDGKHFLKGQNIRLNRQWF